MIQTNCNWEKRGYTDAIAPKLQIIGVTEGLVRQVLANIEEATHSVAQSLLKEYQDLLAMKLRNGIGALPRERWPILSKSSSIT